MPPRDRGAAAEHTSPPGGAAGCVVSRNGGCVRHGWPGGGRRCIVPGMDSIPHHGSISRKTIAAALGIGTIVVMLSVIMLGSQVSGILSTVGASVGGPYNGGYEQPVEQPVEQPNEQPNQQPNGGPGPASGSGVVLAVPRDDVLVIKVGRITMQVAEVAPEITAATDRIDALGGYSSGSKRSGTGDDLAATVTFRIPSEQWDAALQAVRATGEVLDEETSTEDVTSDVVDLGARIRNLQVTEQALQSIMDKAGVIKDVLSVQAELTATRGQIEQLTSQKAHLEEQAAFSTLTATFALKPEPAVVVAQTSGFDPAEEVDAATAKLIRGVQHVARGAIWLGIVWLPILLALAIGSGIAFFVGRRIARWWGRLHRVDILGAGGAGS